MRKLKLSQNKVALIDNEDLKWLNQWKWSFDYKGYAMRGLYFGKKNGKYIYRMLYMHKAIFEKHYGEIPINKEIDHKDGNGLNNQKNNLRLATKSENGMNKKKTSLNKSGYKGVCWAPKSKKWNVQLKINGKRIINEYFENKEKAAERYKQMAKIYHKEFYRETI